MEKRRLTKSEYKQILRHQRNTGTLFTKKERSKLKKLTFEDVSICEDGFIICGDQSGSGDWFANNLPRRCFRLSDVLKDRSIH